MNNLMGMVRGTSSSLFLERIGHARPKKKLTHQPKEFVNQIIDTNEWERRGKFLIIFNTLVLAVDTIKIN